jgi:hypothetical protein
MPSAEAQRQQSLLAALWQPQAPAPAGLHRLPGPRASAQVADGLAAYRRNGLANAHRALAGVYPVLQALVGPESFHALARTLWLTQPPCCGDLGEWGAGVADWLSTQALEEAPYLPDLARLEWALHQASRAADAQPGPPAGLALLAHTEPQQLYARWQPGACVLHSVWPVASIWQAHQPEPALAAQDAQRFAAVRQALAESAAQGQAVLIWRPAWQALVEFLPPAWAPFSAALLAGASLGTALEAHPLDFQAWLLHALRSGWLSAWESVALVAPIASSSPPISPEET